MRVSNDLWNWPYMISTSGDVVGLDAIGCSSLSDKITYVVAWRHQAITRTNVDWSSASSCSGNIRVIFPQELMISVLDARLTIHYDDVIMGAMASQITSLTIVYSTVYSDADQGKYKSSPSLAFVQGSHRGPVNSPHKWSVTQKMSPFDDVIMYSSIITTASVRGQCWYSMRFTRDLPLLSRREFTVFTGRLRRFAFMESHLPMDIFFQFTLLIRFRCIVDDKFCLELSHLCCRCC